MQGDVSKADALLADDFVHNDVVWGRQQLVAGPKVRAHWRRGQHSLQVASLKACVAVHPAWFPSSTKARRLVCLQAFKQFVANVREAYPDFSVWIKEVGVCDTTRLFVHWQGALPWEPACWRVYCSPPCSQPQCCWLRAGEISSEEGPQALSSALMAITLASSIPGSSPSRWYQSVSQLPASVLPGPRNT